MEKDIFEDIINDLNDCHYISDLRNMLNKTGYLRILGVVEKLHCADYTVNQWCELIEYILQKKVNFATNQEAYQYLIQELRK